MKIAIQGHLTRGKEVIQIFKDLGTEGLMDHTGSFIDRVYLRDDSLRPNQLIVGTNIAFLKEHGYKVYTLEEFEKEFPFKIGDKVIHSYTPNLVGIVVDIKFDDNIPYRINIKGTICTCGTTMLKPYKEMKEERNITLTLDKAKEWYNKGGELKEVALQAYSEEELNSLPKSWKEFCQKYPKTEKEAYIGVMSAVYAFAGTNHDRNSDADRNICPSQRSAEAHLAMIQLEQLRNCWWGDWKPIWGISQKWCIRLFNGVPSVGITTNISKFLTFPTKEMAEEFLKCFRDLIEKAGDLI